MLWGLLAMSDKSHPLVDKMIGICEEAAKEIKQATPPPLPKRVIPIMPPSDMVKASFQGKEMTLEQLIFLLKAAGISDREIKKMLEDAR